MIDRHASGRPRRSEDLRPATKALLGQLSNRCPPVVSAARFIDARSHVAVKVYT